MADSIAGQWFGYFSYGPEYGPTLEGERVTFSLLIEESSSGQFKGKCVELDGIGANEDVSIINGYIENGSINFTKEYNAYKTIDEFGNENQLEGLLTPRISYKGKFDVLNNTYSGIWEVWTNEVLYGDGSFVDIFTGNWKISRNASAYGI